MLVLAITRGERCAAPIGDGTDALEPNTDNQAAQSRISVGIYPRPN